MEDTLTFYENQVFWSKTEDMELNGTIHQPQYLRAGVIGGVSLCLANGPLGWRRIQCWFT